jgi:predicted carbohydrate-binding protein with CBM5 and CBM33 domain
MRLTQNPGAFGSVAKVVLLMTPAIVTAWGDVMNKPKSALTCFVLTVLIGSGGAATAQTTAAAADPGHPRINEVQRRVDNQENRVDRGISDGQINAKRAAHDDAKLSREQKSLSRDEARNGGHITKTEQRNLNRRLNRGSRQIHRQRH